MNAAIPTTYKRTPQQDRDRLILDNIDFVARILSTMTFMIGDDEARENLHSAGVLGLVEAANAFDPSHGVPFRTFSFPRIRGSIIDELRKQSPVSQAILQNIGIVRRTYEALEPPVTPELLADKSGLTLEQVVTCLEAMRFIKPDHWNDLSDVVHNSWRSNENSPASEAETAELQKLLAESIESLPERECLVLTLYFKDELNLAEIGKVLDLSESRVSRILAAAKFRLQEMIRCKTA